MATTREIWYSDRAEDIRQFLADAANPAPKTNPSWGHIATFIVWSVLFLVIASFVIRHLRKRNGRLPRRPVTEKSLRSILFGRGGWLLLPANLLVLTPVFAAYARGYMSSGTLLGSLAVAFVFLDAGLLVHILHHRSLLEKMLKELLDGRNLDCEVELRDAFLEKHGEEWRCITQNWYIRVGGGYNSCVCARDIDFTKPVQRDMTFRMIYGVRNRSQYNVYIAELTRKDGSVMRIESYTDDLFRQWIEGHGGTIEGITKPKRARKIYRMQRAAARRAEEENAEETRN